MSNFRSASLELERQFRNSLLNLQMVEKELHQVRDSAIQFLTEEELLEAFKDKLNGDLRHSLED